MLSTMALKSKAQIHLHKLKTSCAQVWGLCSPQAAEGFGSETWKPTCGIAPAGPRRAAVTGEHLLLTGTWKRIS